MEFTIRPATIGDAVSICELCHQLGYDIGIDDVKENIELISDSKHDVAYVVVYDDRIIAWMQLTSVLRMESKPFVEITGIVVDHHLRGTGVGAGLIRYAKSWAREAGCTKLRVRTNVKRHDAHQFYIRQGFAQTKEQKIYDLVV